MTERRSLATGLDRVGRGSRRLREGTLGVITNLTGLDRGFRPTPLVLREAGYAVAALFAPEHGVGGAVQAGEGNALRDPAFPDIAAYDTYAGHRDADGVAALLVESGVAHVVFDIQDVGARFYTYTWTMYDALVAAARLGLAFTVLDRPNPIGGAVSESSPDPALPWQSSFVGRVPIPARHGLTSGELADHLNAGAVTAAAGRPADLDVVEVDGWQRTAYVDELDGYPWVLPSPNLPTVDTALVYPGTCLFEGTTMSEGRGTTRPFELVGAPWIGAGLADAANARGLPGVTFRAASFTPTQSKYAGELVHGVQLHVRDRADFRPVLTALTLLDVLIERYGELVRWRVLDGAFPIDALWGNDALRVRREQGRPLAELAGTVAAPSTSARLRY